MLARISVYYHVVCKNKRISYLSGVYAEREADKGRENLPLVPRKLWAVKG